MSLLPTAHAGQAFGSRRIDFFTVSGQVSQSEAHTGHVVDHDGMEHDVRLMDETSALAPGDTATVLRVQSGPNRRSRPVAVVNHSRGVWMRAAPDATSLLSRTGVTRTLNWWISVLLLVLVAAASVWPVLHAFLTELSGAMMASVPVFDVYADIAARAPALGSWRLETALPSGIFDALAALGFVPMAQLTEWGLALGAAALSILAFAARSWRLIYVPALAALAILAGAIMGGADATLYVVAGALVVFMLGGLANRIRDGGRFNARVERLSEHVLRNPPQEGVKSGDAQEQAGALGAAAAAAAIATAASVADGETNEAVDQQDEDAAAEQAEADAATPNDTAVNGEAEAGEASDIDLPPPPAAAPERAANQDGEETASADAPAPEPETVEPETAETAKSESGDDTRTTPSEDVGTSAESDAEPVIAAAVAQDDAADSDTAAEGEAAAEKTSAPELADADPSNEAKPAEDAQDARDVAETESADAKTIEAETSSETAADETASNQDAASVEDEDLPSLDAVAAAKAMDKDEDVQKAESETPEALTLDDERTMPVASPPPMAAPAEAAASDSGENGVIGAPSVEHSGEDSPQAPAASAEAATENAPANDPLIDDAADPMVEGASASDPAPGAPEVELDTTSAP